MTFINLCLHALHYKLWNKEGKQTYHVCDPNPYHMSWSISNTSPTIIVCFGPRDRIKKPNIISAQTDRMPTVAINTATITTLNPITCNN